MKCQYCGSDIQDKTDGNHDHTKIICPECMELSNVDMIKYHDTIIFDQSRIDVSIKKNGSRAWQRLYDDAMFKALSQDVYPGKI